jgi:Fe-S oxidoreductase
VIERSTLVDAPVTGLAATAYSIPTDAPESDGTLAWAETTIVVVEVEAGGRQGLGYTYTNRSAATLIRSMLADVVRGRSAMDVPGSWVAMCHAVRNVGRPGLASTAIAAVDAALWDLKARLLDLPLVSLLGSVRSSVDVYGSGGFTSYPIDALQRQLVGWVESGITRVKMKIGRDPTADVARVRAAREVIGPDAELFVDANGAFNGDLHALYEKYEYEADLFGHFGQGCVHCRVGFDLETADGVRRFRSFMEEAADLVHSYGGSLSGEHGDGQARGELLSRMFSSPMVQAFREFKAIWDPDWKMNPGKVVDANPLDANLRIGPGRYPGDAVRTFTVRDGTHFTFAEDGGFANATRRCVGIGNCRKDQAGTMCPSYMVTREEQHATRGRARLLFEMLQGDPLDRGWDNEHVHEALDLCLSCKGCKGECPVHVDMATYKAEFLSHYYEHHWRPRSAYAFGLIHTWAGLASRAPRVINALTQSRGLRAIAKFAAGMPQARGIPRFAPFTFREWFLRRSSRQGRPEGGHDDSGNRVILWPDTFNNHFHPETAIAAVRVLERLGFNVEIPTARLCCGRPLYDYGMLSAARRTLEGILQSLEEEIDAGVPIVGLEPSCVAVFRDELVNLFPNDFRARRLSAQVVSLGEFLSTHLDRLSLMPDKPLGVRALVHGHCHQKALFGMEGDRHVLDRLGVDYQMIDAGCCGMAGSFGFERDHYEVSQAVGERRLLPTARAASPDTVIVADGFSCREQVQQATGRHALHLAEVVAMAAHDAPTDDTGSRRSRARTVGAAAVGAAVLLLAVRATFLRCRHGSGWQTEARPV